MHLSSGGLVITWRQFLCLDLFITRGSVLRELDGERLERLAYDCFNVGADREGAGQGHDQELLLHVPPTGEDEHGGEEEEDVAPLDVVAPEVADDVHGEEADHEEEEEEPGKEETPAPGS